MIDKVQKIRKKVEKLMYGFNLEADIASCEDAETEKLADIKYQLCKKILDYIDEVQEEPVSEDLEESADEFVKSYIRGGTKQSWLKEGYIVGAQWQKERLIKEAIDGIARPDDNEIWCDLKSFNFKDGDKIKVIVIKED